jgi:hypothetical protein
LKYNFEIEYLTAVGLNAEETYFETMLAVGSAAISKLCVIIFFLS